MKQRLSAETLVVLALALVGAGCSGGSGAIGSTGGGTGGNSTGTGGSGGGGTAKVTTLADTKAFKDLTDAELTQLCNDTFAYFGSSISSADRCKWAGLQAASSSSPESDAKMQTTCATHQNLCNTADAGTGSNFYCFGSIDPLCTATVAQYSTCISDETAGFGNTVKGFPACGAIKISDVPSIMDAELATPPASCATFANACSGLDVPNPLTL